MKTESRKTIAGEVAGWSLVVLVLAGGAIISGIADLSDKSGTMPRIFVFFLSAILVVQIIPALMLLSAMFKGVVSMFSKKAKVANRK